MTTLTYVFRGPVLAAVIEVAKEHLRVEVSEATGRVLIFMTPTAKKEPPVS
jgi:hypothetical protein